MNTKRTLPKISSALLALTTLSLVSCGEAAPVVLNSIRAVVNGEPITQNMVDSAVRTEVQVWLMGNKGMVTRSQAEREIREMEERALDDLIDRNLILSEFERLGGQIKDQYVDESVNTFIKQRFEGDKNKFYSELNESGMTIAQFRDIQRDQIAIQALRGQHMGDSNIPNTPWEKKRKYEEIKDEFASEGRVKLRILSIPKQTPESSMEQQKALLDTVRSQLLNGTDFGSLAKEHSVDSFASKGGYVGVIGRGTLNEGLTRAAYAVKPGQISSPMDDGPFWRILKVEGRVGQTVPNFDDLEEEVDKRLTLEKRQKNLETWLKKLRRDANVRKKNGFPDQSRSTDRVEEGRVWKFQLQFQILL
ncbi:MAG: SurA N-terminal domain-containing protein, partial [Verrucomicrobiota bacterium]